ncbi:MAG: hypothetical protein ABSA30_12270, partial [Candidatus Aminicenantales bacterium]
ASLALTPATTTTLAYRVRARLATAPATDNKSWVTGNVYTRVVPPSPSNGLIVLPSSMEFNLVTAQTYPLTAKVQLALGLDPAMYTVVGEWHLPDGSVVSGTDLKYSPTAADAAKHQALLEYDTWIDGFKDKTLAVFRRGVTVTTYAWPAFQVTVKANPAVTAPIIGARNLLQLETALSAAGIRMTPELRAEISALSPEPPPATDRTEERTEHHFHVR